VAAKRFIGLLDSGPLFTITGSILVVVAGLIVYTTMRSRRRRGGCVQKASSGVRAYWACIWKLCLILWNRTHQYVASGHRARTGRIREVPSSRAEFGRGTGAVSNPTAHLRAWVKDLWHIERDCFMPNMKRKDKAPQRVMSYLHSLK